jgi:ATP-dependent Clp protease ATP-binding subunit ClpB
VDELIMFAPLNEHQIKEVVKLQIESLQKLLKENGTELEVSEDAIQRIAEAGFDPQYGARPVKRAIQKLLLNDLSKAILSGRVKQQGLIKVDVDEDGIKFSSKQ